MRKILVTTCIVGALLSWNQAFAQDYQLQTGINWRWHHPSFVWWAAARYPHGGHWIAIGHPPEIFHPYPWFLVYPTGVSWPSGAGWVQYGGHPETAWSGYSLTPAQNLPTFPSWPHPTGTPPSAQPPVTAWPGPQAPPYYWFGR